MTAIPKFTFVMVTVGAEHEPTGRAQAPTLVDVLEVVVADVLEFAVPEVLEPVVPEVLEVAPLPDPAALVRLVALPDPAGLEGLDPVPLPEPWPPGELLVGAPPDELVSPLVGPKGEPFELPHATPSAPDAATTPSHRAQGPDPTIELRAAFVDFCIIGPLPGGSVPSDREAPPKVRKL